MGAGCRRRKLRLRLGNGNRLIVFALPAAAGAPYWLLVPGWRMGRRKKHKKTAKNQKREGSFFRGLFLRLRSAFAHRVATRPFEHIYTMHDVCRVPTYDIPSYRDYDVYEP